MKPTALRNKIVISCVLAAIAVMAGTSALDALTKANLLRQWDDAGARYLDRSTARALATFAVVRGINGVISVLQGTDMALSPAGVGVRVAIGEILDPVNDLVERFSWVMLVATTSLGIQKVLMQIGKWIGFKVLLTLSMAILLIGIWIPAPSGLNPAALGIRLLILAIVIRFCIPAVAFSSDRLYDLFLEQNFIEATARIDTIQEKIKETVPFSASEESPGSFGSLQAMLAAGGELVKIKQAIATLREQISDYAEHTVNLIIVFVLQTVLIPLLVLWLLVKLLGFLCTGPFAARLEHALFKAIGTRPQGESSAP